MPSSSASYQFEKLLEFLKTSRGFDFNAYKRTTLTRRIQKRMADVRVKGAADYMDYLEVHPEEFGLLFNAVLINVTSFYRDPAAWECLASEILPHLLESKRPDESLRIWCAGCSSGEEPYTITMIVAQALGEEGFRRRAKIYATDVDEEALNEARQASYGSKSVEDVPPDLMTKYFQPVNGRFVFDKELRRSIIFGRHDLIQDAPISHVDLIICRNTLMYFNAEAQGRILSRFAFALNDAGLLFLGKAEMMFSRVNSFTPLNLKCRIFAKVPTTPSERAPISLPGLSGEPANLPAEGELLREAALNADAVAQVLVDQNNRLLVANEPARTLFQLSTGDLGRPLKDLDVSYKPVELRSLIDRACTERRPIIVKEIEWQHRNGTSRYFDVNVVSLFDGKGKPLGSKVTFLDVTVSKQLQEELAQHQEALETAYEELQSSNEELQTTNEELQSTMEELETTNEELQSTNEELETLNEELQSSNEELETANEELQERADELNQANAFLESLLTRIGSAIVVLDHDLHVVRWNRRAEDLWGAREDEVSGKNFLSIDIGLPVEQLKQPIRLCLSGKAEHQQVVLDATNRRGRPIRIQVTVTPLIGGGKSIQGVILMMDEHKPEANGK